MDAYEYSVGRRVGDRKSGGEIELFLSALIVGVSVVEQAVVLSGHNDVDAVCAQHFAEKLGYFKIYVLFDKSCRA